MFLNFYSHSICGMEYSYTNKCGLCYRNWTKELIFIKNCLLMKSFDYSDIWTAVFNLYLVSLLAFKFYIKIQNVKHGYSISSLNNLYFNASANVDTRMRLRYNSQDYWRHCPSSWEEETWRLYLELQLGHWTLLPKPLLLRISIKPMQKTTQACNRKILSVLIYPYHVIFKEQQSMDPKTPTEMPLPGENLLLW